METEVLLSDFAQQLHRKNENVPGFFFTLLDAAGLSPTLVLNQNPKRKRKEAGPLSKSERQKLQRLYTQVGATYGSVRSFL